MSVPLCLYLTCLFGKNRLSASVEVLLLYSMLVYVKCCVTLCTLLVKYRCQSSAAQQAPGNVCFLRCFFSSFFTFISKGGYFLCKPKCGLEDVFILWKENSILYQCLFSRIFITIHLITHTQRVRDVTMCILNLGNWMNKAKL